MSVLRNLRYDTKYVNLRLKFEVFFFYSMKFKINTLKYIDKNVKKCLSEQHEYIIMHKFSLVFVENLEAKVTVL